MSTTPPPTIRIHPADNVAVVVNQWQASPSHIPAFIGLGSAVRFYFVLGPDQMILPALSASVIALAALKGRYPTARTEAAHD